MPMMTPTRVEDKGFDLQGCLEELQTFVRSAAGAGTPVHEVERGLWRRLLQLGYQLQGQFFALVGDGDQGETVTLAEGQVVRRLRRPEIIHRGSQGVGRLLQAGHRLLYPQEARQHLVHLLVRIFHHQGLIQVL